MLHLTRRQFLMLGGFGIVRAAMFPALSGAPSQAPPAVQPGVDGTTYYVDADTGDNGDTGTAPEHAWQDLSRINRHVFRPGDRLLFKTGTRYRGQLKPRGSGALIDGSPRPIVIDRYGGGPKPRIDGGGHVLQTVWLHNVEYWELGNLEITNTGGEREAGRKGVYVQIQDFGTAHHIVLRDLEIHDVNGSLVKQEGGGSAISWRNEGAEVPSRFDGLRIEGCHIRRTERNAITGSSGYWQRTKWYPSLHVVIRNNLIQQVPGDGIVPIGCDGALVERNVMRDCTRLLPDGEAAAGIWPWSCDNTVVQYNEVSDHKAPWDAQGFDADWNCRNTVIQFNYSHDNEGGFLLVCNPADRAMPENIGNRGTIVRYNISLNDGLRATGQHAGFSPAFHISGDLRNTRIYNNLIYIPRKPDPVIDRTLLKMDNWGNGWPEYTQFLNNILYAEDQVEYDYGAATNTVFSHNLYFGEHRDRPDDPNAVLADPLLTDPGDIPEGRENLDGYKLQKSSPCINAGLRVDAGTVTDFWGDSVPAGFRVNIGPREYQQ